MSIVASPSENHHRNKMQEDEAGKANEVEKPHSHEQKEGGGQMLRQKSKAKSNCKQKSSCAGKKSQREVF